MGRVDEIREQVSARSSFAAYREHGPIPADDVEAWAVEAREAALACPAGEEREAGLRFAERLRQTATLTREWEAGR